MYNTLKLWWAQAGEGVIVLFQLVFGMLSIKPGTLHMLSHLASLRGTLLPSIHSTHASASLGSACETHLNTTSRPHATSEAVPITTFD